MGNALVGAGFALCAAAVAMPGEQFHYLSLPGLGLVLLALIIDA